MNKGTTPSLSQTNDNTLSYIASVAGFILGVSYPLLAISTGVRAIYQLFFKANVVNYIGPSLSAVAALVYLIATIGFFVRKKWAWQLSVGTLVFEVVMVVVVGTLSISMPDTIGHTVWGRFGLDYGFFPLIQPILGLLWLFRDETMRVYGIRQ